MSHRHPPPTEADLAALADGSISPRRREPLLERVRQSSELSQQQRAVAMTRAIDVQAPAELHERIAQLGASAPARRRPRPRLLLGGGLVCSVGVIVAAL